MRLRDERAESARAFRFRGLYPPAGCAMRSTEPYPSGATRNVPRLAAALGFHGPGTRKRPSGNSVRPSTAFAFDLTKGSACVKYVSGAFVIHESAPAETEAERLVSSRDGL